MHDLWVEVDKSALKHNFRQAKSLAGEAAIMAVVKANAFGHGYVETSRAFIEAGADALMVTRMDEAVALRSKGIDIAILVSSPIQPSNIPDAVEMNLDLTVANIEQAKLISSVSQAQDKITNIHIKVDTGMSRLGVCIDNVIELASSINYLPNVKIGGMFTHFATAAERDISGSLKQNQRFLFVLRQLDDLGISYTYAHAANSAALIRIPEARYDMVRPGTILYGQYPSPWVPRKLDLKPTWQLKARICEIREIASGSCVGYGADYVAGKKTVAAVVPVGYADGFTLSPSGPIFRQSLIKLIAKRYRGSLVLYLNNKPVQVLGRVAMQLTTIDITDFPGTKVGDEVVVPAMRIPTSALIPRVYV